jgi:F-type H+-transporting ATPase subunit b
MDQTLRQLGDLLLGSIPTIILFLVLFVSYRLLLHAPLERVLSERRDKTEGALEKARADIAAAEAKTAEYERALREARLAVFAAQEDRRRRAAEAHAAAIAQARAVAGAQVQEAKAALEKEIAASKVSLSAEGERLATEVIQSIFKQVGAVQAPATGGTAR